MSHPLSLSTRSKPFMREDETSPNRMQVPRWSHISLLRICTENLTVVGFIVGKIPKNQQMKAQYVEGFMKRVQRAYDKAVARFHEYYAGIDYDEEIVRTYAPYPQVPSATSRYVG